MALRVLYFAAVRDAVGLDEEAVEPPAEVTTLGALVDWLAARSPGHAAAFADRVRLRAAIDATFAPLTAEIAGAAEIAFFPPVTGG
jgi:sulfur-carrier protein